jgi:hypothetical protein
MMAYELEIHLQCSLNLLAYLFKTEFFFKVN